MSREIKFRAYWKKEKRLCKVHSLHFGTRKAMLTLILESDTRAIRPEGQGSEHEISKGVISVPFGEIVLEQFTGLKDKNGREIYEGDIVKIVSEPFLEPYVGIVGFDEVRGVYDSYTIENNRVYWDTGNNFCSLMGRKDFTTEIIGNIHDNPDLLENKNE